MATLLSITDGGNMMTASTWRVVEPTSFQGNPIASLTSTVTVTTLVTGTSFVLASTTTIVGVALQISGRAASPTGTLNVQFYDVTGATILSQVTINVSDLPNSNGVGNFHIDWVYFKFPSPVTTIAGRSYAIRAQASVVSQFSWYYTTTTTNPNRALVTTTTQAPVTGDVLIIAGEYTAAGVNSTTTVIMNDNGTIQTGTIWISSNGIFKYLTFATFSIYLFSAGHIVIGVGGTFNIGTISQPITVPVNSQVFLLMICTTALQFSIFVYGTFTTYGEVKTIASKLASDVAAGAISSNSIISTGWKSGDRIVVTSTTRTYTENEVETLSSNAIGTAFSHSAYTFAHGGNATTKIQADIVNISRNILILSNLNTARSNIQIFTNAKVSFYYTTFQDLGTGATIANSGICVNALTLGIGSFDFQGSVVTMSAQSALTSNNCGMFTANDTATTISNNIFYSLGWTTTGLTLSIFGINNNNYIINCLSTGTTLVSSFMGSNNVYSSNLNYTTVGFYNNATNNSFYSNSSYGLLYTGSTINNTGMNNFRIWRNNNIGLFLTTSVGNKTNIITFDSIYMFGNLGAHFIPNQNSRTSTKVLFSNSYFYGGTTFVTSQLISNQTLNIIDSIYFNNCYFGYSDSNLTSSPFSTAVLTTPSTGQSINFNNCFFNSPEVQFNNIGISNTNTQTSFNSTNHNGVTGSNRVWHNNGLLSSDPIIYNTTSPSLRMAPVSLLYKLPTTNNKIPVKAGQTCTVSVKVRKSTQLDGTLYNGNQPRLMYVFNPILGNLTETIGVVFPSNNNLLTFPENFDNVIWNKIFNSLIYQDYASTVGFFAPDNTDSLDIFIAEPGSTTPMIVRVPNSIAGATYSLSIYAHVVNGSFLQIRYASNGTLNSYVTSIYDLSLGTITQTAVGSAGGTLIGNSITPVGDGWFRLALVASIPQSDLNIAFILAKNGTGNIFSSTALITNGGTFTGDIDVFESLYSISIWGALLELGSVTSQYISQGGWQTLTYTTATFSNDGVAEFYVDCDGTLGWINVDDWSTTTYNDTRGTNYWGNSSVYIEADYKVPSTSYTFIN